MWTNLHSGLRWLGVALIWAGTGHYLQTSVYIERRLILIRRLGRLNLPTVRRVTGGDR